MTKVVSTLHLIIIIALKNESETIHLFFSFDLSQHIKLYYEKNKPTKVIVVLTYRRTLCAKIADVVHPGSLLIKGKTLTACVCLVVRLLFGFIVTLCVCE